MGRGLDKLTPADTRRIVARRLERQAEGTRQRARTDAELELELNAPPSGGVSPRRVLLTGATGSLGAYVLRELLEQTSATIFGLVRASDEAEGRARLELALARAGGDVDAVGARLQIVPGDLSQPRLGLPPARYDALSWQLDAIHHVGARVDFMGGYAKARAANVEGTLEILRLAGRGRSSAVHHTSTVAVFCTHSHGGTEVGEDDEPRLGRFSSAHGYCQSKWVAERLVDRARRRGVCASIYRVGALGPDHDTGRCNLQEFMTALLLGCIQLEAAPQLDMVFGLAPVDRVAAAMVAVSLDPHTRGQTHHLTAPGSLWSEVVESLVALGVPLRWVDYRTWLGRLDAAADNVLHPIAGILPEPTEPMESPGGIFEPLCPRRGVQLTAARTVAILERLGRSIEPWSAPAQLRFLRAARDRDLIEPARPVA